MHSELVRGTQDDVQPGAVGCTAYVDATETDGLGNGFENEEFIALDSCTDCGGQ